MNDLRTAAQQALKVLEAGTDVDPIFAGETEVALRAALAQQVEPQGCATEEDCTKQPWCRIRGECQRKQAEPLNLRDPAVQKRLASQWGYVPAAQAEPVEPVAWLAPDGSVRETPAAKSFGEWVWGPDDFRPLYTAPPQRKPLTLEEIYHATGHCGVSKYTAVNITRAVEKASWEKNHGQA